MDETGQVHTVLAFCSRLNLTPHAKRSDEIFLGGHC